MFTALWYHFFDTTYFVPGRTPRHIHALNTLTHNTTHTHTCTQTPHLKSSNWTVYVARPDIRSVLLMAPCSCKNSSSSKRAVSSLSLMQFSTRSSVFSTSLGRKACECRSSGAQVHECGSAELREIADPQVFGKHFLFKSSESQQRDFPLEDEYHRRMQSLTHVHTHTRNYAHMYARAQTHTHRRLEVSHALQPLLLVERGRILVEQ